MTRHATAVVSLHTRTRKSDDAWVDVQHFDRRDSVRLLERWDHVAAEVPSASHARAAVSGVVHGMRERLTLRLLRTHSSVRPECLDTTVGALVSLLNARFLTQ